MASIRQKNCSKTYGKTASINVSTARNKEETKVDMPIFDVSLAYKSSTLNKADQLFDEVFNPIHTECVQDRKLRKPCRQESNVTNIAKRVHTSPVPPTIDHCASKLPSENSFVRTRNSPRSAEKRSNLDTLSPDSNYVILTGSQHSTSSQNSLADKIDGINLDNSSDGSPVKKTRRSLFDGTDSSKDVANESMVVNVGDHAERVINFSQCSFLESSEGEESNEEGEGHLNFKARDEVADLKEELYADNKDNEAEASVVKTEILKDVRRKPVYKHKWNLDAEEETFEKEMNSITASVSTSTTKSSGNSNGQTPALQSTRFTAKLKRTMAAPTKFCDEPISQLKCRRKEKEMYTVIKHVKQAHQCHESGEVQQIFDDIRYYLENLRGEQEKNVKYLSLSTIAQKCTQPSFRAHLRAYGYARTLFHSVASDYNDPVIALCAACVFYLLSRDRSSLVIDSETLNLALKLMNQKESDDSSYPCSVYSKYKAKIWSILSEWHKIVQNAAGFNNSVLFDITEDNLSASFLTTESMVYIFLRNKNDELLKLSMCKFGGLDLLVKKIEKQIINHPESWTGAACPSIDNLKLLERYLRILELVTASCPKNQAYLIAYEDASILNGLVKLFSVSISTLSQLDSDATLSESSEFPRILTNLLAACLRVLCNLTHLNEIGCEKLGLSETFLVDCVRFVVEIVPLYMHAGDKFDFSTLALGILINLVESCNSNRKVLICSRFPTKLGRNEASQETSVVECLTKLFLKHEAAANAIDEEVDKKIEFCSSQEQFQNDEVLFAQQIQETLEAAVGQAGRHMEDSMLAAHISLFFGLLLQQNETVADDIKWILGGRNFEAMIGMLNKFMDFLKLIDKLTSSSERTVCTAIELLERLSGRPASAHACELRD